MIKLVLAFCFTFLLPASVFAVPPPPSEAADTMTAEARRRFDEGKKATTEGDFERARIAYMQTYLLNQSPVVLRNLGIAEIRSGHWVPGARHLSTYLHGEAASTETAEQRAVALKLLTETEAKIGRLQVDIDSAGAEVRIDGELVGRSPILEPSYVEPGTRMIMARRGDRERTQEIIVRAGEVAHVSLALEPLSGVAGPPAAPRSPPVTSARGTTAKGSGKQSVLPLVLMIAAGTATAVSATAWYVSAHDKSSADRDVSRLLGEARSRFGDAPCQGNAHAGAQACIDLHQRVADGQSATSWQNYSRLATGIFAVSTVAAVGYWWTSRRVTEDAKRETDVQVGAWLLPQAGGLTATGAF